MLAEKVGAHLILDTGTWNLPEQSTGMNVTGRWLSQNRATALNVIKASIEGIARWKKDPAFVKEVTKKYLKQDDQRYIDVGYEAYASIWPKAPYPSRDGFVQVIEEVSTQKPKAKSLNPDQLFDASLVKELEDSGFIKQVYGS